MDTSTLGHPPPLLPMPRRLGRPKQSFPLFHWLAHCDDVTSHDIIIILINAVTHHEELFLFKLLMVEHLRTQNIVGGGGKPQRRRAMSNLEPVLRSHVHH